MINNLKEHLYSVFVISILSIVSLRKILFTSDLPAGWDISSILHPVFFFSSDNRYFDLWEESSIGYITPLSTSNFLSYLAFVTERPELILKFAFLIIHMGIGTSFYFFSFYLIKEKISSLISAVVYTFNPWILSEWANGDIRYPLMYFLAPIIFYLVIKTTSNADKIKQIDLIKSSLYIGILLSLLLAMRFDPFGLIFIFIIIYVILFILITRNRKIIMYKILFWGLISIIIFLVLTAYILIPLIIVKSPFLTVSFSYKELYDSSLDILNVIQGKGLLYSYLFYNGGYGLYVHPFLSSVLYQIILIIIPVIALSVIIIYRNNKNILLFTFLLLFAIFLSKGPYQPLTFIYEFAYENIPIVKQFHSPNRIEFMIWLIYSLFVGYFLEYFKKNKNMYAGLILIILSTMLLSGSEYVFINGYQTFNVPQSELEPHLYLKSNDNIFRVITEPFGYIRMFTQDGWLQHEIGWESGIFSGKSVLRNVRFESNYKDFFYFLEYISYENMTKKFAKIVGIYDVKYFVQQGYPITQPHHINSDLEKYHIKFRFSYLQFFKRIDGLKEMAEYTNRGYQLKVSPYWEGSLQTIGGPPQGSIINVERPSKIYENLYWTPRIFYPQNKMLVVGGANTFLKLAEIRDFNFSDWNLLFSDHLVENLGKDALIEQINKSDYITFANSEPLDLAMLLINKTLIKVKNFEKESHGWNKDNEPITEGFFVYSRDVISAKEKDSKAIYRFEITNESTYEIWTRVFYHNKAGKLKIVINNELTGEVEPKAPQKTGFKWVKIDDVKLQEGEYKIEVINEKGENKLNGIIIAEKDKVNDALNYVENLTDKKSIYLLDTETHKKIEGEGKNVIWYQNDKPAENADVKTEKEKSVKYLDFKKIQPSKWIAKVNSTDPYTLVFSNSYHPMWRAYVNGREYRSIPSYYFINSFQIDETGEHEVVIEFIGQRIQNISLIISGLAYLGCFGYLFYDWRRGRGDRWTLRIKNKFMKIVKRAGINDKS